MATPGEIAAMDRALASLAEDTARLQAAAYATTSFSIDDANGLDTRERAFQILEERIANTDRFAARRNELAQGEDHEAIAAFVEGIAHMVGIDIGTLIMDESAHTSYQAIVAGALGDTLGQFKIGIPLLIVGGIALYLIVRR